jgi:uracil-DNA glycosylase
MGGNLTNSELIEWLAWYRDAGVDCALGPQPLDWLDHGAAPPGALFNFALANQPGDAGPAGATRPDFVADRSSLHPGDAAVRARPVNPVAASKRPQTPLATREAESEGRRAAQSAKSLDELEAALRAFTGCSLKATATNLCFYRGSAAARIVIVGEAPGRDEDMAGKPFVGRAGQLLDKMLASIGLDENHVHITNIVYWRPPGNRTPTTQEALACRPFLERQIELVDPDFVVAFGGAAAKEVLGAQDGIMKLRGRWRDIEIGGKTRRVMATLHPAYLLRTPAAKQLAWSDLLRLKASIEEKK